MKERHSVVDLLDGLWVATCGFIAIGAMVHLLDIIFKGVG